MSKMKEFFYMLYQGLGGSLAGVSILQFGADSIQFISIMLIGFFVMCFNIWRGIR